MTLRRFALLSALLLFASTTSAQHVGRVDRADARLDQLLDADARPEVLAEGFAWSEGPVWVPADRALLFSDIPNNTIYRWSAEGGLEVFLRPAGHNGANPPGGELGTNGLTLDGEGRLVMCDHGNRMVARLDRNNWTRTPLATHHEGRRLNSPNDLAYHSRGDLYFTDPPYGLDGQDESPAKELSYNGVYRVRPDGTLDLLTTELTRPNGLAFSPDERTLYVAVSDPAHPRWMAYDVTDEGRLANGRIFFDASEWHRQGRRGLPDGLAVDVDGHLFATGPGGVVVLGPDGAHLGTIDTGRATANVTFGEDGSTLFITADDLLLRLPTRTRGLGFE